MDMVVIVCVLGIAVCTLVYLFSLQHSVDSGAGSLSQYKSRDVALGCSTQWTAAWMGSPSTGAVIWLWASCR